MPGEIQKRFEQAAEYDRMMTKVFAGYEQLPLVILSYLRTRVAPEARVLDAGCGTGTTLAAFATHQAQWSLVGVDPAEPMLSLARSRADDMNLGTRVELVHGTVDALPDERAFDAATLILVEHLLPDNGTKLHLLEAIHHRIRKGGWFVLAGLHGDLSTPATQSAAEAWFEFVDLQGLPKAAQENVRKRATVEDSLVPEQRIRELLDQSGFADVELIYKVHLVGMWLARNS